MERIEPTSFVLEIKEYGKTVRQYNDVNYERFMSVSKQMIDEHMNRHLKQKQDEVKNATFHIYTY
ncbi:MAG: hypothetical protein KDE33_29400 [Bacteroidetes bacterium]|mgnify:CR=1 FL=1|nr:hypothetical protein [Bacteroidota bacterium]